MASVENGSPRPTMTDVAAAAGVSLKTVSRVVNAEPGVTPETARRVHEAIQQLGFRRNNVARALRRGQRLRTIGLVIEDLANPFYSAIARGAEEVVRDRGMLLIVGSSDEDPVRERELSLLLCERRVDGLLVVPAGDRHRHLLPEMRLGVHAVFVDRPPGDIEADAVLLDNAGGARSAVDHLLARGHRRIGMVGNEMAIYTARERWRGFVDGLAAAGCEIDDALVRVGVDDVPSAERVTGELLSLADPPTALFSGNNRTTIGVLRALARRRAAVEVVGFDDLELADLLAFPFTAVAYDAADLGRKSAELLLERLAGDASPPRRVTLPTSLVVRGVAA